MLLTFAAFFFVLSIVVFVHELGHFVVAKLNRIYVITFSFGFGPKLLKFRAGETEYALSALPFGGYVKFAGETGEADGGGEELPDGTVVPPERMYHNAHALGRMSVVLAGPFMNFLLALLVYVFGLYAEGIYVNPSTTISGVDSAGAAASAGFRVGDRIVGIESAPVDYWFQIEKRLAERRDAPTAFTVIRGGDTLAITASPRWDDRTQSYRIGIESHLEARVGDVKKGSPADRAGLRSGALILAIDDTLVAKYADLERRIRPNIGKAMAFTWEYEGEIRTAAIVPEAAEAAAEGERLDVVKEGQIGIGPYYAKVRISFAEAAVYGWRAFSNLFDNIIGFLSKLFTGKATLRAVGGPLRVGIMAGDMIRWGFNYLVYFLAFFSLNLAIFNLLPVLPFDGGHVVLALFELVTRRRIGKRVQHALGQIGFVILILLMVFILTVDVFNVVR